MATEGSKLGAAYVEIAANIAPFEEAMARMMAASKEGADDADGTALRVRDAWTEMAKRVIKEVNEVTEALNKVGDGAENKLTRAKELVDGIGDSAEQTAEKIREMDRAIEEVQTEADLANAGIGDGFEESGNKAQQASGKVADSAANMTIGLGGVTKAASRLRTAMGLSR